MTRLTIDSGSRGLSNPFELASVTGSDDDWEELGGKGGVCVGKFHYNGATFPNLVVARFAGDRTHDLDSFHVELKEVNKYFDFVPLPNPMAMNRGIARSPTPSPADREVKLECVKYEAQFVSPLAPTDLASSAFRRWLAEAVSACLDGSS
jgi:hypothetical protein